MAAILHPATSNKSYEYPNQLHTHKKLSSTHVGVLVCLRLTPTPRGSQGLQGLYSSQLQRQDAAGVCRIRAVLSPPGSPDHHERSLRVLSTHHARAIATTCALSPQRVAVPWPAIWRRRRRRIRAKAQLNFQPQLSCKIGSVSPMPTPSQTLCAGEAGVVAPPWRTYCRLQRILCLI